MSVVLVVSAIPNALPASSSIPLPDNTNVVSFNVVMSVTPIVSVPTTPILPFLLFDTFNVLSVLFPLSAPPITFTPSPLSLLSDKSKLVVTLGKYVASV